MEEWLWERKTKRLREKPRMADKKKKKNTGCQAPHCSCSLRPDWNSCYKTTHKHNHTNTTQDTHCGISSIRSHIDTNTHTSVENLTQPTGLWCVCERGRHFLLIQLHNTHLRSVTNEEGLVSPAALLDVYRHDNIQPEQVHNNTCSTTHTRFITPGEAVMNRLQMKSFWII